MSPDLAKAWFAIYIVGISLIRLLDDTEHFRLTSMKKYGDAVAVFYFIFLRMSFFQFFLL